MSTISIPIPPDDDSFWGGDGTDGHRPVRTHVLAALLPAPDPYPPPVDALRRLGDVRTIHPEAGRITGAITQAHLPDLIRMARDRHLFAAPSDSPDVWAQMHALYLLAELDLTGHLGELIPLLDLDSEWLRDSTLPELFAEVGPPAVPHLQAYLLDHTRWGWGHFTAARALQQIAADHPETRGATIATFTAMLDSLDAYGETSCTAAMDMLVELGAVEALLHIRRAFERGKIDEMVRGDWGAILDELGLEPDPDDPLLAASAEALEAREDRIMPRELRARLANLGAARPPDPLRASPSHQPPPRSSHQSAWSRQPAPPPAAKTAEARARKARQKRKQEAASRKANRKKR